MEKFKLGQIVATASIAERMERDLDFERFITISLERFKECDWGDLCEEDKPLVDEAVKSGDGLIMGVYKYADGQEVWIMTEWDHSVTTILYPHER